VNVVRDVQVPQRVDDHRLGPPEAGAGGGAAVTGELEAAGAGDVGDQTGVRVEPHDDRVADKDVEIAKRIEVDAGRHDRRAVGVEA